MPDMLGGDSRLRVLCVGGRVAANDVLNVRDRVLFVLRHHMQSVCAILYLVLILFKLFDVRLNHLHLS